MKIIKRIKNIIYTNEYSKKVINNAGWLVAEKVFTMLIGVFVTSLIARYFGPESFGQYNYALSFVTLFIAFSALGLETLTVKALVDKEYDENTILSTSLFLRVIGGIIIVIISMVIIRYLEPNDINIHILVFILSLSMIFKALEVIEYWIQAKHKAKISSIIRMLSYIIIACLKVILVVYGGTLIHYALIYVLNTIIIGIALIISYGVICENKIKIKINFVYAKKILSQSWFLILSGLMVTLYMQIDKVMLGKLMSDKAEVGIYSAATAVAGMWYFIPLAIITAYRPIIMKKKKDNNDDYLKTVQLLYTIITWTGIFFGIFILFLSNPIILILYGSEYEKATNILSISIWAGTFAMLGSAREPWLISEGLQRYSIFYIGIGAVVNIILNYLLIPILGGYGAALATLVTQIITSIVAPFFFRETRYSSIMMLKSFVFCGLKKKSN